MTGGSAAGRRHLNSTQASPPDTMADINLSLDDLIKKNKQTKARPAKTAPKKAAAKPVTKSTAGRGRGRGRGAATAGRGRGATVGGVARNPRAAVTRAPFKPRGGLVSAGKVSRQRFVPLLVPDSASFAAPPAGQPAGS